MTDIVEHLRMACDEYGYCAGSLAGDAADEIERLRAELAREHADHRQTVDDAATLARQLAQRGEPVACHVFNVTVSGRLYEWEPTTFAFALKDGKHALYTAPPQRQNPISATVR